MAIVSHFEHFTIILYRNGSSIALVRSSNIPSVRIYGMRLGNRSTSYRSYTGTYTVKLITLTKRCSSEAVNKKPEQ